MPARQQRSHKINCVETLKNQQSASSPGKNQRALQPQPDPDQNIPDVAEVKKVLRPILPPVNRRPDDQPDRPCNLQPQRHAHAGHCSTWPAVVGPGPAVSSQDSRLKTRDSLNYSGNLPLLTPVTYDECNHELSSSSLLPG